MNEELPLDTPAPDPIREWERESHLPIAQERIRVLVPIPGLEKKEED